MNLVTAHGLNNDEIKKFYHINTTKYISIAEFKASEKNELKPFKHSHDAYEFIIPFDLIPLLEYDQALYIGEVGYCYPVNPNVEHGVSFDLNSNLVSIAVDKEYLDNLKEELHFRGKYFYSRFLISKDLLTLLEQYLIVRDQALLKDIVRILVKDGLKEKHDTRKPKSSYFTNMKKSIVYMLENYTNPDLTIEEVSAQSNYSYTYFTKAFKKYMNDTPINHLNRIRLSKAKQLMKDRSLSLTDVYTRSGFKTQSNFTMAFKRIVGINPLEYRKKYIK
jgi:AraC-like DNA-binding protein